MRTLTHPLAASASSPGIDLAPMLDFVVNLLIFFLVTAVFVRQPGITLERPKNDTDTPSVAKSIVIDDNGIISIDNKAVDLYAVRAHIEQFRAASSEDSGVVIVAHEHAKTGVLVAVADQVYLGGIGDITFSTAPQAREDSK
jgi:biopolymer transport protein ExbD